MALYNLLIDLRANVANLQADMTKAVGILERSGRLMTSVTQGIFQGLGQALGREVLGSISRVSTALEDLASKGNRAGAILENFQKLGGSASGIEQAKKAILGTVDAFELMRVANEGLAKGIPNLNQNFAKLTEFANKFADATGQDTVQVLNQLITAMGTGAPKALQAFGFQLDEGATKAQNQAAVYDQLLGKLQQFAPIGESVTQGQERLSAAISEAISTVGIAINDNQALTQVYNQLAEAVELIDWKEVGQDIASIATSIVSILPTLDALVQKLQGIAQTVRIITGNASDVDNMNVYGAQLQSEIESLRARIDRRNSGVLGRTLDNATNIFGPSGDTKDLEAALKERERMLREVQQWMRGQAQVSAVTSIPSMTPTTGGGSISSSGSGSGGGRGGSGSGALDKLKSDWARFTEQDVRRGLSDAIRNIDPASFLPLKEKLQSDLETSFIAANKKFVDAKLISLDELNIRAKTYAAEEVAEYQRKMDEAITDRFSKERKSAEEIAEIQRRAAEETARMHQDAVNSWQNFYTRIFSGQSTDYRQALKELASGFMAELSASFFGELKGNAATFEGIGQLMAAGLGKGLADLFGGQRSSGGGGSYMETIQQLFGSGAGSGMTTEQAHASGVQGPGAQDGTFNGASSASSASAWGAYIQAAMMIAQSSMEAKDKDKGSKSNEGTGAAVGAAAGAVIGSLILPVIGTMIGAYIGQIAGGMIGGMIKWGPQNKETIARHSFANWMEDRFKEMNGFTVMDRNNANPTRMTNFVEGPSTRFNQPGWADEFNETAGKTAKTFTGLGNALKELLGITEEVGDQLGLFLGENLNFNINNARHLVKRLGVTFEQLQEKLVEMGRQGKKTWLEIETEIQGVSQAFKPGLVEVGAVGQAFQNVINSGARGFFAIQSLRDIGEEAAEDGIKDLGELRERLLKTYDPEIVDKFFQALEQRGIKTIAQLQGLTDRDAGGVIADMQALGVEFKEVGEQMNEGTAELGEVTKSAAANVKEATVAMRDLTKQLGGKGLQKTVLREPTDEDVEAAYATGGIVSRPTRALMGEAGPEAILPLARKNGKLGVHVAGGYGGGSGMVIHIDARGATPGVEGRIRSAIKEAEDRAVRRMVRSLQSSGRM